MFPYEDQLQISFETRKIYKTAFYVVIDLLLQTMQREPYMAIVLSRLNVCQGPFIIEIVIFEFIISSFPVLKQLGLLLYLFI